RGGVQHLCRGSSTRAGHRPAAAGRADRGERGGRHLDAASRYFPRKHGQPGAASGVRLSRSWYTRADWPASRRLERCRVFRAAQPGRRALSARVNFAVCQVRTAWSKESEMEQQTVKIGAKQAEVPDARGYYGEFGGRFVPETLVPALDALTAAYFEVLDDPAFQAELAHLQATYTGRPTPITYAARLSDHLGGARIYLKREDLAHTGAHKINN